MYQIQIKLCQNFWSSQNSHTEVIEFQLKPTTLDAVVNPCSIAQVCFTGRYEIQTYIRDSLPGFYGFGDPELGSTDDKSLQGAQSAKRGCITLLGGLPGQLRKWARAC